MNDNSQNPTVVKIERVPEFARLYDALSAVTHDDPRWAGMPLAGIIGVLALLQNNLMNGNHDA